MTVQYTNLWGLTKPDPTTVGKEVLLNLNFDLIDQGRLVPVTANDTLVPYGVVYVTSGFIVGKANNGNRPMLGFSVASFGSAVGTVTSGTSTYVQVDGHIINSSWGFTPGLNVYVDPSSPGLLTQTQPGSLGWPVGVAISSNHLQIFPPGLSATSAFQYNPSSKYYNILNMVIPGSPSLSTFATVQFLAPYPGFIRYVQSTCRSAAATGTYQYDLYKNGSIIYTTAANRPTRVSGDGTSVKSHALPDVTSCSLFDSFYLTVESAGTGISDFTLAVFIQPA